MNDRDDVGAFRFALLLSLAWIVLVVVIIVLRHFGLL